MTQRPNNFLELRSQAWGEANQVPYSVKVHQMPTDELYKVSITVLVTMTEINGKKYATFFELKSRRFANESERIKYLNDPAYPNWNDVMEGVIAEINAKRKTPLSVYEDYDFKVNFK